MHLQRATEIYFLLREVRISNIFKKRKKLVYFILINEMYDIHLVIIQIKTKPLTNKN